MPMLLLAARAFCGKIARIGLEQKPIKKSFKLLPAFSVKKQKWREQRSARHWLRN